MKKIFALTVLFVNTMYGQQTIVIGEQLINYTEITAIAEGANVQLSSEAIHRIKEGHDILISAAESGHSIYGLTVGVGLNKDQEMIDASGKLSEKVKELSREFNKGLIYAHVGAVGDILPVEVVRATMAVRLNNIASGSTGVTIEVAKLIEEFLNKGITPVIPETGSIGMADITVMGHLGLALISEGEVFYKGKTVSSISAMKSEGLTPVKLYAKDALSIISSNALSSGRTALLMSDLQQLIAISNDIRNQP